VYPQDVELTVESMSTLIRPGCIIAAVDHVDNSHNVMLFAELRQEPKTSFEASTVMSL
jgi:hypothetical protein